MYSPLATPTPTRITLGPISRRRGAGSGRSRSTARSSGSATSPAVRGGRSVSVLWVLIGSSLSVPGGAQAACLRVGDQRVDVAQHPVAVGPRAGEQLHRSRRLQRDHRGAARASGSRARAHRAGAAVSIGHVDDLGHPQAGVQQLGRHRRARVGGHARSASRGSARRACASSAPSASASAAAARPAPKRAASAATRSRARSASTSSTRHVPRAELERGVADGRAGAARAEQHDVVGRRAGQPARERLLEAGRVGVVPDEAVAGEDDRVDRLQRRGLRGELVELRHDELLAGMGDVQRRAGPRSAGLAHEGADVGRVARRARRGRTAGSGSRGRGSAASRSCSAGLSESPMPAPISPTVYASCASCAPLPPSRAMYELVR